MLLPKRVKHRKQHRGRMTGRAMRVCRYHTVADQRASLESVSYNIVNIYHIKPLIIYYY